MITDVHAHFTYEDYKENIDQVIKLMKDKGVKKIISNGLSFEDNINVLSLSKKYNLIDAAFGLYPTEAGTISDEHLTKVLKQIKSNKDNIVAIGEVGLDYHWTKIDSKKKRQKEVLQKIIDLANKIKKPLIVHSRKAESDVLEIMKSAKVPVILHCFSGNSELIDKAIEYDYYFSIPVILLKSKGFKKIVKKADLKRILTETDSPFLSIDGKINNSSNIQNTIDKIAEIKNIDSNTIVKQIYSNYKLLFNN
ncbi:MAG: TatD family hydrolase [Candidatus Woesearchaeota archaeon]